MDLVFDRVVSPELLGLLTPDGPFGPLLQLRGERPDVLDIQLRREHRGQKSWASLYLGLTCILDIEERKGLVRLDAHAAHRTAGAFDSAWAEWQPLERSEELAADVSAYVERMLGDAAVDTRWFAREGRVHAALASDRSPAYGTFQREASISFPNAPDRDAWMAARRDEIWSAVEGAGRIDPWWPGIRDRRARPGMGSSPDFLGVDHDGRLLVIEAKPSDEPKGVTWAPAQVRLYAELFGELVGLGTPATQRLQQMIGQRQELGLLDPIWTLAEGRPTVVPVIAIPADIASSFLDRLAAVAEALDQRPPHTPAVMPLEVWLLDDVGDLVEQWRPSEAPIPQLAPAAPWARLRRSSSFADRANAAAIEWKSSTPLLTEDARRPGTYEGRGPFPVCLPAEHREQNLLPEAREIALSRFAAADIRWHGGAEGPSNHLRSSQVQCLNALAPFVERPDDLAALLGRALPIAEVLPFGAETPSTYDRTDHVVFEWQGLVDHLGEWGGRQPTRGEYATSADAAMRYRTHEGRIEVALIEWKYTEQYGDRPLHGSSTSNATRLQRYETAYLDPDGPVVCDDVGCADGTAA